MQGIERSTTVDADGLPAKAKAAPVNPHDSHCWRCSRRYPADEDASRPGCRSKETRERLQLRDLLAGDLREGKSNPQSHFETPGRRAHELLERSHEKSGRCIEHGEQSITLWFACHPMIITPDRHVRQALSRYLLRESTTPHIVRNFLLAQVRRPPRYADEPRHLNPVK